MFTGSKDLKAHTGLPCVKCDSKTLWCKLYQTESKLMPPFPEHTLNTSVSVHIIRYPERKREK